VRFAGREGGVGNPLYRDYEKLVEITILGNKFQVPEKNICLRAFQYVSPETIPYGRFCWNQECQLCRVSFTMAGQEDVPPRPILACKVLVAEGMQIVELSDELKWNLSSVLKPAEPRPPLE
jgi:NADH dehydrogenase/NADH:ubiquinone oxidoreductase subunit G